MTKDTITILFDFFLLSLAYLAFYSNNQTLSYIFWGVFGVLTAFSFIIFLTLKNKKINLKNKKTIPLWKNYYNYCFDFVFSLFLVLNGFFLCGALWFILSLVLKNYLKK